MNVTRTLFLAGMAVVAMAGFNTYAFHSGGVAECGGCHSMHEPKTGGVHLLIGTDPSSTCLSCHEHAGDTGPSSYHISTASADMPAGTAPKQRTPGGDFGWVKKTYTFTLRGSTITELGQTHGHNIVAYDNGYLADTDNTTAPGGTFLASQLGCNSCHDPHGKARVLGSGAVATGGAPIIGSGSYNNSAYPSTTPNYAVGVYRLLYAQDSLYPTSPVSGVTYNQVFPAAVPSTYNRTESATQTRAAYGTGITNFGTVSGWCGSCHEDMHNGGQTGAPLAHPTNQALGTDIASNYGKYISSGNMTGSSATSFLSLVPFAENTETLSTLRSHAVNNNSVLNGPSTDDRVMCLSCHRAHATGFPEMLRWNYEGEFITSVDSAGNPVWPGTDTTPTGNFHRGRLAAETQAAYYDRPVTVFGAYQRQLCNKCHAKD